MTEIKVIVDDEGHDVDAVFEEKIEVGGGGGIAKETDPTVPDWAKRPEKPEYTYEEIKQKPTLVEGVSASVEAETFTIKLEDKDGNEIASTQVTLPKAEIPDLTDYVKNTDYISSKKAGILADSSYYGLRAITDKGVVGGISRALDKYNTDSPYYFISKGTLENIKYEYIRQGITTNTETWTDAEMKSARDLIGAVGKTDYAANGVKGVVDVRAFFGLITDQYARIQIVKATNAEIDEKTNEYHPIVPKILDYATMKALSDCKDTSLWTDDSTDESGAVVKGTKTKALELLGALAKGTTDHIQLANGTTMLWHYGTTGSSLARRLGNGSLWAKMSGTYNENELVNMGYVNDLPNNLTLTEEQAEEWRGMIGVSIRYRHTLDLNEGGKIIFESRTSSPYTSPLDVIKWCIGGKYVKSESEFYCILGGSFSSNSIYYIDNTGAVTNIRISSTDDFIDTVTP